MSLSRAGWFGFRVSLGGMYTLKMLRCFLLDRCILISWVSIVLILQHWGSLISVKVMLFLTYVSSPPPSLSCLSSRVGVNPGIFGVLLVGFSLVY